MNFAAFFTGEWRKTKDRIAALEERLTARVDADVEALDARIAAHYNGRVSLLESRVASLEAKARGNLADANSAQAGAADAMTKA